VQNFSKMTEPLHCKFNFVFAPKYGCGYDASLNAPILAPLYPLSEFKALYKYCIISASLSISKASVRGIPTDVSPRPSVCLCVCQSGKCTVAKRLNGSGCLMGWSVGSVKGSVY